MSRDNVLRISATTWCNWYSSLSKNTSSNKLPRFKLGVIRNSDILLWSSFRVLKAEAEAEACGI